MINNIEAKTNANKEILSSLPKNNKKNIIKHNKIVEEIEKEYKKYKDDILTEMQARKIKLLSFDENNQIKNLKETLSSTDETIYLLNNYNSSYEKIGLDKDLYDLSHYYKTNFERVNEDLARIINKFKLVGLSLIDKNFNYSIYVNEYMKVFLDELSDNNLNFQVLKECFDKIYWKCPDIITHIELNLKGLYYSNQKLFDKYIYDQKEKFINKEKMNPDKIMSNYLIMQKNYDEISTNDTYLIFQKFKTNQLNYRDYSIDKITKNFQEFSNLEITNHLEFSINIKMLFNSLKEYKEYLHFLYLIDKVKKSYEEKLQYKNIIKAKRKLIAKTENNLKKLNKKLSRYIKRNKTNLIDNTILLIDNVIIELKKLYDELDEDIFNEQIINKLHDDSSIYDLLCLIYSYYLYFIECIKTNDPAYTDESIKVEMERLRNFLTSPYNTIIDNISIIREKNIPMIISDRYKLLNIDISMDSLNIDNIDNLIEKAEKIITYYSILNSKLKVDDISFIIETEKIFKEEEFVSVL